MPSYKTVDIGGSPILSIRECYDRDQLVITFSRLQSKLQSFCRGRRRT